jgi:hypothetical protein
MLFIRGIPDPDDGIQLARWMIKNSMFFWDYDKWTGHESLGPSADSMANG